MCRVKVNINQMRGGDPPRGVGVYSDYLQAALAVHIGERGRKLRILCGIQTTCVLEEILVCFPHNVQRRCHGIHHYMGCVEQIL
jgi:hypothetical protein